MGRRPVDQDNDISLFPFLSILACIIGVLTLMIATLALSQMDSEVVVAAEKFENVSQVLEDKTLELSELQNKIDQMQAKFSNQASQQQKEQIKIQKRLATINVELLAARKNNEEIQKKQSESMLEVQQQPLEEIQKLLSKQQEDIATLAKEIKERKLPPQEAEFSVLPGGSGTGITPYFIECTKTDIVVHQKGELLRIRAGQIETNPTLIKLFDEVVGQPRAKVIFLIRDDAVHVWGRVRNFANSFDVPNGKLPVLGHGRINLSQFQNH